MSSVFAPLLRIEERALSIGLRVKRTSEREVGIPQFHGFAKPLLRGQCIPLGPLGTHEILRAELLHDFTVADCRPTQRRPHAHAGGGPPTSPPPCAAPRPLESGSSDCPG